MFRRFPCILIIAWAASLATTRRAELAVEENPAAVEPPQGFGGTSSEGAGGRSVVAATLADSRPGSPRAAPALQEARTIVFAVLGAIMLESRLRRTNGRLTIAAGSAPAAGIMLMNRYIQFHCGRARTCGESLIWISDVSSFRLPGRGSVREAFPIRLLRTGKIQ